MTEPPRPLDPADDLGRAATLVELVVADAPDAWRAAGFTVDEDRCRVGATTIRLAGGGPEDDDPEDHHRPQGITGWTLAGLAPAPGTDGLLDGLATRFVASTGGTGESGAHPNGATGLDHVVVLTPDLDRTIAALGEVGLACRRVRETTLGGAPARQAFFRLGATVLEVVHGDLGTGTTAPDAPATWWGLTVDVADLDRSAALLGAGQGRVRPAVQRGRRIATFRSRELGLSVAVAAMDDHADR